MFTRNGEYVQIAGKFPRVSASDPTERLREVLALVRAF
jgi:transcription-repair coupling factor (superfamily II helicase)